MKKTLFVFLLSVAGSLPLQADNFQGVDTKALNKAYGELMQNPASPALQRAFFNQFPSTWGMYNDVYRYSTRPGFDDTMYFAAAQHVEALKNLDTIDRKEYYGKLIHIGIGGRWMADAPNYLRTLLMDLLDNHTAAFFQSLSTNSAAQQLLFWRFVWENPVKDESLAERYDRLKQTMGQKYPREVKTMGVAYEYFFGELPMGPDDADEY